MALNWSETIINLDTFLITYSPTIAIVVAMVAIYITNKNSKQQILVGKYEELFEVAQLLGSYYDVFMLLSSKVVVLKDIHNDKIQTIAQYHIEREKYLPTNEKNQIITYLSRLEVLTNCYTKKSLYKKASEYNNLMLVFYEYVFTTGSLNKEIRYKNGFPNYEKFYFLIEDLKKEIISQIKLQ